MQSDAVLEVRFRIEGLQPRRMRRRMGTFRVWTLPPRLDLALSVYHVGGITVSHHCRCVVTLPLELHGPAAAAERTR